MADHIIEEFLALFQGNKAAIGSEEGGCIRLHGDDADWNLCVEGHLDGSFQPIGVYPMVGFPRNNEDSTEIMYEYMVYWGCIDWDVGDADSLTHARNVQAVLSELGHKSWVERSRSKGYHLWVFANEWVPAVLMRQALLAACQIVEAPAKEVNPKQTKLNEGQLGNYVRLPYPGAYGQERVTDLGARRVVIDVAGIPYPVGDFTAEAYRTRLTRAQLEDVAALYVEPVQTPKRILAATTPEMEGDMVARLGGLAHTIFIDGPLDGAPRGKTLYKLMMQIAEDGNHTLDEIHELLCDADFRWGKFHAEGRAHQIDKMIDDNLGVN